MTLKQNLSTIQRQLAPNTILLAVSKNQPVEKIIELYHAGQRAFGENYLQEALLKIEALKNFPDIEWHFIGSIQRNKTRKIAENFDWVQSVENNLIAERLSAARPENLKPLNICLEVNISNAKNKSGVLPENTLSLAKTCLSLKNIKLRGLMCIPEKSDTTAFTRMKKLFDEINQNALSLDTLSMGMSDDFEQAMSEGSTMIRIGTKIFGERV